MHEIFYTDFTRSRFFKTSLVLSRGTSGVWFLEGSHFQENWGPTPGLQAPPQPNPPNKT
jgi:hypothetical protein